MECAIRRLQGKRSVDPVLYKVNGMLWTARGRVRTVRQRIADTRRLLGRHVPQARQMLRKLIEGRIVCRPFDDERGRGYEVSATGNYAGLLRVPALLNEGGGEGGI